MPADKWRADGAYIAILTVTRPTAELTVNYHGMLRITRMGTYNQS